MVHAEQWWIRGLIGIGLVWMLAGCGGGEPVDRPEDCKGDEFFNQRTDRCRPCPVYEEPSCKPGCGFEIVSDQNGCPKPVCHSNCELCETGEFYSVEQGTCQSCPGVPTCVQFDCEGELRITDSFSSQCPSPDSYACGACTDPSNGCVAGDNNRCVDK